MLIPLTLLMLESGLKIKDVTIGKGPGAVAGDYVLVDYTGKLSTGKQFDTSIGREPFGFLLGAGQVIKGWDRGVVGMKASGNRNLTIPADLGYGARGAGADIPGGATLVFDVKLIKLLRAEVKTTTPGKGLGAEFGDAVSVHYTGKLATGTKFDSSYDRNEPFLVTVGQGVIPGFSQGLLGIKEGEKRTVTIPAQLGYGKRGVGPIPANSDLVFELEAVKLYPAKK